MRRLAGRSSDSSRRRTTRISAVLLVLAKIDAYLEWEAILEENRALLRRHVPQFAVAPFFPVSSAEKREADVMGDARLAAESGVAVEGALVQGVLGGRGRLRLLNGLQSARIALDRLDEPERAIRVSLDEDLNAQPAAEAALREHQKRTRDWNGIFTVEFQRRIANRLDLEFKRRLGELARRYDAGLGEGKVELDRLRGDLELELRALATDMETLIVSSAQELALELLQRLGLEPATLAELSEGTALPSLQSPAWLPRGRIPFSGCAMCRCWPVRWPWGAYSYPCSARTRS